MAGNTYLVWAKLIVEIEKDKSRIDEFEDEMSTLALHDTIE